MNSKITKVQRRDGTIVDFDQNRISDAILKALTATGLGDGKKAKRLSNKVIKILNRRFKKDEIPHVEQIQDIIEEVLILEGLVKAAKAFILYREQRRRIREAIKVSEEAVERLDQYLEKLDWEVQENANMAFSLQGLNHYGVTYIIKKYWLNKIYPKEIREAYESGDFHIHNLDTLGPYCVGWDLYDLLIKGFGGVPGKVESKPAKHFDTALMQCVNFLYTLQGEAAGAVSFSNFDTLLAPFIRYDNLNYQQVKQALQEFLFNLSIPTRVGFQNPFTNITLDLKPSPVFAKMPVIIGGKPQDKTYGEFEEEMKIFDKALYEVYMEGDAKGRPFHFPIPTINITKDFPWDEPAFEGIFEASAKYGINYFANYINSEMKPDDVRSMCLEANEEILIRNSKKIKRLSIKEVTESYKDGDFDEEGWAECKKEGNLEVLSLNPETLKLEWVPVKRFLKIKDDKAVEVITEDGKISLFSLKHPVSVYTPEGIKMKFAKDLQKGDYLLTLKRANENIFSNEYQKIEDFVLDEDLAKILGYLVADGNYLFENRKGYTHFSEPKGMQFTFKTGDQKNLEEIKYLIKKVFNLPTHEKQDSRYNTYYLYVYNTEIARKLYKAGFKKYGRLPQILFNSPKSVIESFLEFYFRGDGYEKRKEIHLNDSELSRDLVLLFSLISKPVTYKLRKRSQRIYLQHAKSKIKKGNGRLNNPILAERVPGWMAVSTAKVPGLIKSRTVGFDTLEKYNAHTEESLKIKNSDIYLVGVKEIKIRRYKKLKEFYDIELERNHLFVHSLGQISFNCCRLRLNLTELYNRGGGGLFGSGSKTGSIGVVTINLPRIGYLSKTKKEFFERLARIMDLAKESLEIKRKVLENFIEKGLYPYSRYYLQDVKQMRGKYWANHFSTIGLVGMNECLLNFMGENIASKRGRKFALEVLDFMRERLLKYQQETGNVYNLEATPAESTAYRLALKDKERYPDIITAGTKKVPYYSNSSQLPVNFTDDIFEALKLQDEIQCKYTGGVVFHIFLGERMQSGEGVKKLVKKVFENFKLPYITITPTFCYDEKTQILTENGWKFFWELKEDEKVLTTNPETKELSYQLPLRRFKFYYQGPMIHFKSRTFDCKVTPDHRMFISGKKIKLRDPKTGKFIKSQMTNYFVKAKDVSFNDRVPMTGFKWKGKEEKFFLLPGVINNKVSTLIPQIEELLKENKTQKEIAGFCNCSQSLVSLVKTGKRGISENFLPIRIPMESWLKFFGIWIAEGSVRGSKGGEVGSNYKYEVVIKQKDKKIKNEIREMLKELPFKFSEFLGGFVIYNKQLWHYLSQFGNSRTKYIPKEIKALSPRLLKIFLEWYLKGDGSKNGKYCCSFSPGLRDDLQEIYLKIGFDASVSEKGIITKRRHRFTYLKEIMHVDNYSGYVYCVEVPNHVIYVRRNGKPNFSGNSICPVHGYLEGEHFFCPKCTIKQPCEVYTRIVGYLRPVQQWNLGKQQEFKERKEFKIKKFQLTKTQ
jgi:ribonucleoside-triphosphate reductase